MATKVGMLARRIGRGARGANDAGYGGREGERGLRVVGGGKRGGGELINRSMRASYCVASGVELVCWGEKGDCFFCCAER